MTIKLKIDLDEFEKWLTPERMEIAFHNAGYEVELKDEYKRNEKMEILTEPLGDSGLELVTEILPDRRICFRPNRISTAYFAKNADIQVERREFEEFLHLVEWNEFIQIVGFNEQQRCFSFKINTELLSLKSAVNICIYFIAKKLRFDEDNSEKNALKVLQDVFKEYGQSIEIYRKNASSCEKQNV